MPNVNNELCDERHEQLKDEIKELKTGHTDHDKRLNMLEQYYAVLSKQLSGINGILKFIAGLISTIAGALIIEFIKNSK